ncbi:hypothetical protein ACS0TY_009004 [Phlomoides rotata]
MSKLAAQVLLLILITPAILADEVPVTKVQNASDKGAVCLDGSPAAYYYAVGTNEGFNRWIVYLMGGGWCSNRDSCQFYRGSFSTYNLTTQSFVGILSSNKTVNPDFYNWNRVYVHYCDGASFLGDSANLELGFQFRGSVIFRSVVEELLQRGMGSATDAILTGSSAGGLACMLHCDEFQASLPSAAKVKCVADAAFFIRGQNLPRPNDREGPFANVISFHNLTNFLPYSCTSRLNPSLCLFPEYFAGGIRTPLFIVNSAFDSFQISANLNPDPPLPGWKNCKLNTTVCSPPEQQLIKDFGKAFLDALGEVPHDPSRGIFIITCYFHVLVSDDAIWNSNMSPTLANNTIAQAVGGWYFDQFSIQLIDTQHDFPSICAVS